MKLWKWQPGRQKNTVYQKFPIWYFRIGNFGFDAYLLKYAPKTLLPYHKDPVENGKHWRLNIKLKGIATFICDKCIYRSRFITIFRPDLYEHMLCVYNRTCLKLSFGFVKFEICNKEDID